MGGNEPKASHSPSVVFCPRQLAGRDARLRFIILSLIRGSGRKKRRRGPCFSRAHFIRKICDSGNAGIFHPGNELAIYL